MSGWVNVDASPDVEADIYLEAPDFVRQYGDQVDEVYMGHLLEHLLPGDALSLLTMMCQRLPQGTVVSAVTPDIAAVWAAYQAGEVSNDELNASFIYSYVQPSHHVWCYDEPALLELFRRAGFADAEPIDPLTWPPVYHKEGPESRWQCGVKATALGARPAQLGAPAEVARLSWDAVFPPQEGEHGLPPATPLELAMRRVQQLRAALVEQAAARTRAEQALREGPTAQAALPGPTSAPPAPQPPAPQPPAPQPGVPQRSWKARVVDRARGSLPTGTRRREVAKATLASYRETVGFGRALRRQWTIPGVSEPRAPRYPQWLRQHQGTAAELQAQREQAQRTVNPTRVQVVVLPGVQPLQRTLRSLVAQTWGHWTAVVCLPEGADGHSSEPRVQVARSSSPYAAANDAVANCDTDFVIFMQAGDALAPDCLYQVAVTVQQDPLIDLVSWDDDVIDQSGGRSDPRFRPSWSPDTLLSANYLGRAFAMRRRRFLYADGLRERFGEAALWDLLLRAGLDEERVARVPRLLGSVSRRESGVSAPAVQAVAEHLERLGWPATAEAGDGVVRLRWALGERPPHVSIIIPTRHNRAMLSDCLPALARTDYPSFDVAVVDNGGYSPDNEEWYARNKHGLDLSVQWWTEPFNYSKVNNRVAAQARGEILVFLNDDTEPVDPQWLAELVGWATRPGVGVAGLQLHDTHGAIQHGGVVLGMNGFADHLFQGMRPGSDSMLGPVTWYRNTLAVTGACLAIRRELFETLGGFDERFVLCGSDVALGLSAVIRRYRNVCSPATPVRHAESATRGSSAIPQMDFFASYWRYSPWLFGGDPYYSPSLALGSTAPKLRSDREPTPSQRLAGPLGRSFKAFRQSYDPAEARMLALACQALPIDAEATEELHRRQGTAFDVESVNWFLPSIDSPHYGGINTALRIADKIAREHGVRNRFVIYGDAGEEMFIRSALAAAFPTLADVEIVFYRLGDLASLEEVPAADVSIATLWTTAYSVTHFPHTKRKFYLIQDFEPMFYPAGTLYALAEETYRLGLYGLCNTDNLRRIYRDDYGGRGMSFTPAVDQSVFHAEGRPYRDPESPATVFIYARPGHWRNCWELAAPALEELKQRLGDGVRIVAAGAWAAGEGAQEVKRLGLLDYRATGELYRRCDVGVALTLSKHPSYLPLELMACGVPVVAFDNPWGHWILRDGENCLLAKRTVDSLVDRLEKLCTDPPLRARLSRQALADIAASHSDWDKALAGIYPYLCNPEGSPLPGTQADR
jgi:GT2 family glycosyltransferase/glycosyltransferase involved in cell wall biosynthesis